MTEVEIAQEVEDDAREVRLTEQKIFRDVLDKKQRKSKRTLSFVVKAFLVFFIAWLLLHCLPLVIGR